MKLLEAMNNRLFWKMNSFKLVKEELVPGVLKAFGSMARDAGTAIVIDHMVFSKKGELVGLIYKLPLGTWVVHRKNRKLLKFSTEDEAFNAILDWGNKQ